MNRIQRIESRLKRFGLLPTVEMAYYKVKYHLSRDVLKHRYFQRRIHDYQMLLDTRDPGISSALSVMGTREDQLRTILLQKLKPGNVILDLGANIGYYAVMQAKIVGPTGYIYAIEPHPDNIQLLRQNIALNHLEKQVETFQMGGSDRKGVAKMFVAEYSNLHTFIPTNADTGTQQRHVSGRTIDVEIVDLSSFLQGKKPVDLIRMDIEGYEVEVLTGLRSAIESGLFKGKIVFEVHRPKYSKDHSLVDQLKMLFKNGYHASILTSNDERTSKLKERYPAKSTIQIGDDQYSGIYENVRDEDVIEFLEVHGGIRDILFEKKV